MDMDLAEMVVRCKEGDRLAWEALVRATQGRVYAMAYGYVGDRDAAEDLAQEIMVRVFEKLPTCRDPHRFIPWLVSIARNVCVDHLRRDKCRRGGRELSLEECGPLPSSDQDPSERLQEAQRRWLVWRALRRVSRLAREMIVLREMQGLSHEEIASILAIPVGTVKSRANRARIELAREVMALMEPSGRVGP